MQSIYYEYALYFLVISLIIKGAGKSTLLNLIMDRLTPIKGSISRNGNLRIGHFTQHSADKFDLHLSAVENMLNTFQDSDDQGIRSFLGKFQIQGSDALKPMMMLSGGQKSRVAFASLAYRKNIAFLELYHHLVIIVMHQSYNCLLYLLVS